MLIIKRDGQTVEFEEQKIEKAILKAMTYGSGVVKRDLAEKIANEIKRSVMSAKIPPTVKAIEHQVYLMLVDNGEVETAKSYEGYRAIQEFKRNSNTTDDNILGLVHRTNELLINENSNKNGILASTQRDLIAGEVSKDITRRMLLPTHIVQAHDQGLIHFHDMDYHLQSIFNCCLVNLKDMLDNGTVINGKMVETPKSFQTACTITTQIIAQVASSQYGGQTVSLAHLAPYVRVSYNKHKKQVAEEGLEVGLNYSQEQIDKIAMKRLKREIKTGVQTIQYQINTLLTTNGQSPFVSLFMYLNEDEEYRDELALIIEEVLEQRYTGIKNEKGVYITPAFPKLLYVLDENNIDGGEYEYLTKLAVKCVAKRMMPDFISAKKMKEHYGYVFPCMGCRSWLAPWENERGEAQFYGRFNGGVVSLNLVDVALTSKGDIDLFWDVLQARLNLCKDALLCRYEALKGTISDVSPIHWQYGALARLKKGETIDSLLENGRTSYSLGYVGLYECIKYLTGKSHTSKEGEELALKVMTALRDATDTWKDETGLGFGLYGTPAESLVYTFATKTKKRFGEVKGITDKLYFTNSYHVNVTEEIDAFSKLSFEAQFQKLSSGGCISYVEIPNMNHNLEAVNTLVNFMYHNIQYSEINTKSDYCQVCGFDGEIIINDHLEWECPNCGNKDKATLDVTRRTCGYLGSNFWNKGRTQEIKERVLHL